jgi:glutamate 5-kinase
MVTKLRAAARMMAHGDQMVLANGRDPRILLRILDGEELGTWFRGVKDMEVNANA